MRRKDMERASREAARLVVDLEAKLPACCASAREDLYPLVWPTAVRLAKLRRKAERDRRAARAYRKLRREVRAAMAAEPGTVPRPDLARSQPFDPRCWRVELVPGAPAGLRERQAA